MFFYVALSVLAGAMITIQTALNTKLGKDVQNPTFVGVESCAIGTVALALYMAAARSRVPKASAILHEPWWMWTGGIFGASFVLVSVLATPKLSVGTVTALVIVGQMVLSVVFDHCATLGLDRHPLNVGRIVAVLLFCAGAELLRRS